MQHFSWDKKSERERFAALIAEKLEAWYNIDYIRGMEIGWEFHGTVCRNALRNIQSVQLFGCSKGEDRLTFTWSVNNHMSILNADILISEN